MLYSGKLLGNIREAQGVSQDDLAVGLCSKVHLFHIETGEREAEKLLFESLYQRLGKYSGRYETLLDNDEYSLLEKRWKICEFIDERKYENARQEIEIYKSLVKNGIHMQYICMLECEIMHKTGEQIISCMKKLEEAIAYTREDFQLEKIDIYYLSRMEMLIIEQYVRYMELSGDIDNAILYYQRIMNILDREYYDRSERNLQGRYVAYHLMKYYFDNKNYNMALKIANKALKYIVGNNYIIFLAEVKQCMIECMEFLGEDMVNERKILQIIKRFNNKFNVMKAEDYFPRYLEERVYNVNEIIRQRRQMNKMTREQLASDFFDSSSVWRMEKRKTTLQKEKKKKLLKLIKLSGDKYIAHIDSYDIDVFRCLNRINDAMYSGKIEEAEMLLDILEKSEVNWELNSKQYIASQRYKLKMVKGIAKKEDIDILIGLLAERGLDVEKARLEDVILLNNEYALLYSVIKYFEREEKQYDKCMNIVQYLLKTYDESKIKHSAFICIAVKTIAGDVLGEMKQIKEANKYIVEGLKLSAKSDVLSHVRGLVDMYIWNIFEEKESISIQDKEEGKEFLEYAYAVCKIYDNNTRANSCLNKANKYGIALNI